MKKTHLAEILRSFNKIEFRDFGKFVNSPFFNNRNEVVRCYNAIKKFYPDFNSKNFTKEHLFREIYPGKKYSDVLMRKLISLIIKQAMDYYAVKSFKDNDLDYSVKILYTLYEKNLPEMFEKKAKHMERLLIGSKHTIDYYEAKSKYTGWVNAYLLNKNESSTIPKFQNELDDLVEYFLVGMLINYNRLTTYSKMYNITYDFKFFDEVIKFLDTHDYKESTLVLLYRNLVLLSKTEDDRHFTGLREFWEKFENKLTDFHQYIIYVALYNNCINRRQKGATGYNKIHFEITKKYFSKNIFPKEMGYMPANLFSSVVSNASRQKEFNWLNNFIKTNQVLLDPLTREETLNSSFALMEFEKGEYEKSLAHLSIINPDRIGRKLTSKNLTIMNFYELNYINELETAIDAYRHYLIRSKNITSVHKEMSGKFLKFVTMLIKLKSSLNKEKAGILRNSVIKTKYFNNKEWILQKSDELLQ